MRAVVMDGFGAADVLRVADIETPNPGPGQILIQVQATTVNRPDIIQRLGHYPPPPGESDILGLECSGTIASVGDDVDGWQTGEPVFALVGGGAYAEFVLADARHALRIPAAMSFEQAACIAETYITAWQNLFQNADLADGETVLLHGGGGGVATAAQQLIEALRPASAVIVTASAGKIDRVAALGASRVIDYQAEDFVAVVRDVTEGRGVDVILDHIGAKYLAGNLTALAIGGRLLVIGVMGGSEAPLNLAKLMLKRQRIIGSVLRPRSRSEKADIIQAFAAEVMPLFSTRRLTPVIDRVLPLDAVVEAHRLMESRKHFGKIVLVPATA